AAAELHCLHHFHLLHCDGFGLRLGCQDHPWHEGCRGHDGPVFGLHDELFGPCLHPGSIRCPILVDRHRYLYRGQGRGLPGTNWPNRLPSNFGVLCPCLFVEPAYYFRFFHVDADGSSLRADVCPARLRTSLYPGSFPRRRLRNADYYSTSPIPHRTAGLVALHGTSRRYWHDDGTPYPVCDSILGSVGRAFGRVVLRGSTTGARQRHLYRWLNMNSEHSQPRTPSTSFLDATSALIKSRVAAEADAQGGS